MEPTSSSSEYRYFNGGVFELHITTPQLEPTDKWNGSRRVYRLTERFSVRIWYPGGEMKVVVPKGFETDFASFPLLLQLLLGNRDDLAEESLVHDWLYREGVPVFFANAFMRILMEQLRRRAWKRWVVFYGLMFLGTRSPLWLWLKRRCWLL